MRGTVAAVLGASACTFDASGMASTASESTSTVAGSEATTKADEASTTIGTSKGETSTGGATTGGTDSSSSDEGSAVTTAGESSSTGGGGLLGPLCGGKLWDAQMDVDPTALDVDGDGIADWSFSGGAFPAGSLVGGVWQAPTETWLRTMPDDGFATRTIASLRLQAPNVGAPAAHFDVNVDHGDGTVTHVWLNLGLEPTGLQTVTIGDDIDAVTANPLLVLAGQLPGLLDVVLDVDPPLGQLTATIAGVVFGPFPLFSYAGALTPEARAGVGSIAAEFDYVTVERCP